jgi:flagellar motor switch protein FliN/FliY
MTTNQTVDANHQSFSNAFFNALSEAITEASGSAWLMAAVPDAELDLGEEERVRIKVTLNGSLAGEFVLEIGRDAAALLAAKVLKEPSHPSGSKRSAALVDLINSCSLRLQRALEQECGAFTMVCSLDVESGYDRSNCEQTTIGDEFSNRVPIRMYLSSALAAALSRASQSRNSTADSGQSMEPGTRKQDSSEANLEMVMDVELNVTLRFGQRQLTLREVLELTSGSVVELDRQVDEPVELLLDGLVIAKGEAVVVDGNYGLRVTEVTRPVSTSMLARA